MKKFAFTLAEALLALGIIGVVSALTLPSVTLEHRKRTYAASLAVAVSDFETAMSNMIIRDNAYNLLETKAWKYVKSIGFLDNQTDKDSANSFNEHVNFFTRPLGGGFLGAYPNKKKFYTFFKTEYGNNNFSLCPFKMKNGIIYALTIYPSNAYFNPQDEKDMLKKETNLYARAAEVWIDVNGEELPNTVGRDIFYFILGADGKLYPYGGKDHIAWNGSPPSDDYSFSKTAELVENHYKMNY